MGLYGSMIYGSESYLDLLYGENYDISKNDDYLVVTYNPKTMPYPPAIGKIENTELFEYPDDSSIPLNEYIIRSQYVNDFINSEKYQQVYNPFNVYDYLVFKTRRESLSGFEQTLSAFDTVIGNNLLNDQVSLDELYAEYFKEIQRVNGADYMYYVNKEAGKVWQQHYD